MTLLKNKQGEWYARDWIIGTLLFSGVIALMFIVSTDVAYTYNRSEIVDSGFSSRYDRFQNNTQDISTMLNVSSNSQGLTFIGTTDLIFQSTTSVVSLIFGSLVTFNSQVANLGTDLGMPSEISRIILPMIIAVIVVFIVFIVITSTTRNKI